MTAAPNYEALCATLRDLPAGSLIGIEGFCSSGKSALADRLSTDIPAQVLHTDKFATKHENPPPYIECLRLPDLRSALEGRSKSEPCLVEGICLRDVLAACGTSADHYVYIRRIGKNGLWYDQLHLETFENAATPNGDEHEPHLSDLKYHSRTRPHERASTLFDRVEDN